MGQYVPKEIKEEVNVTPVHPLVNLANLFATVAVVGLIIYVLLGLAASQLVVRIGPETEEKIGASLTAAMPVRTAAADSRIAYLTELLEEIESETLSDEQTRPYPPLKVGILETSEENAMVTAGSYLFVTDGLLSSVKSENELAFVLAHELGHLHNRDPLEALGRSLVLVTLNTLLGVGQSTSALPTLFNLTELNYSRQQEIAADDYAIEQIIDRYGHGGESLGFFERHREFEIGGQAGRVFDTVTEWQRTHPLSKDRIARLEAQFDANEWAKVGETTPLPENIECVNFDPCGD